MLTDTTRRQVLSGIGMATALSSMTGVLTKQSQSLTGCVKITQPGRYHLAEDLDCLEIVADSVHVDGQGNRVNGATAISGNHISVEDLVMARGARVLGSNRVSIDDSRVVGLPPESQDDPDIQFVIEESSQCELTNTRFFISDATGVVIRDSERNHFDSCTLISPVVLTLSQSDQNEFCDCEFFTENVLVTLRSSDGNQFKQNLVDGDSPGFRLFKSDKNRFIDNDLDVLLTGFGLVESDQNLIHKNVVESGLASRGVTLDDSDNNAILHNDLCDVDPPAVIVSSDSTGNVVRNLDC